VANRILVLFSTKIIRDKKGLASMDTEIQSKEPECQISEIVCKDLSFQVMGAVYEVHTVLGHGFLEKVYENALLRELQLRGIKTENQKELAVSYKDKVVGTYCADIIVDDQLLLELKSVENLNKFHEAQLLNYLKATGYQLGLLINFAKPRVEYKRLVL
jgi:GxxExxY protein